MKQYIILIYYLTYKVKFKISDSYYKNNKFNFNKFINKLKFSIFI